MDMIYMENIAMALISMAISVAMAIYSKFELMDPTGAGQCLPENILLELSVPSLLACAMFCSSRPSCRRVMFVTESSECIACNGHRSDTSVSIGNGTLTGALVYEKLCPDGWVRFQDSCYLFAEDHLANWSESVTFCQTKHHSQLVVIDSREEDRMITKYFKNYGSEYTVVVWLGARKNEGVWEWYTDGRPLSQGYENWRPDQPQNRFYEDCVCLWDPIHYKKWADHYCDEIGCAICEKNMTSLAEY